MNELFVGLISYLLFIILPLHLAPLHYRAVVSVVKAINRLVSFRSVLVLLEL